MQEVFLLEAKFYFIIIIIGFLFLWGVFLDRGEKCEDFQNNKITANVGQITAISQNRSADFYIIKQF